MLPGVVALPNGGGILIAQRQEVKELSHVQQGFHIILKSMVSHSWKEDIGFFQQKKTMFQSVLKGFTKGRQKNQCLGWGGN